MTLFALGVFTGLYLAIQRQETADNHFQTMLDSFPWEGQTP